LSPYVRGRPGSGEASLDEAGLGLDLLQAVLDDLDQVAEAGDGEVGQHAALEHRPDPFQRVEIRVQAGGWYTRSQGWALAAGRDWAGAGGGALRSAVGY
jgi:hypothetical protein